MLFLIQVHWKSTNSWNKGHTFIAEQSYCLSQKKRIKVSQDQTRHERADQTEMVTVMPKQTEMRINKYGSQAVTHHINILCLVFTDRAVDNGKIMIQIGCFRDDK